MHLHNTGIKQWTYPWLSEDLEQDIVMGYTYVLSMNNNVIGTFTIRDVKTLSYLSLKEPSKAFCQIAILPEYQGKNLGSKITSYACSYARRLDQSLYLDCWAKNERLKAFYSNNSFEYIGDFPEEDYNISAFQYNA